MKTTTPYTGLTTEVDKIARRLGVPNLNSFLALSLRAKVIGLAVLFKAAGLMDRAVYLCRLASKLPASLT
jgi:hypothetical protein